MKYIRTKDGRIITLKDELIENVELWVLGGKENILRIANTIEEMCDEFILTDNKGKKHYSSVEGNIFFFSAIAYRDSVRGAIFTDKGLIYVAKMNDKGELELL